MKCWISFSFYFADFSERHSLSYSFRLKDVRQRRWARWMWEKFQCDVGISSLLVQQWNCCCGVHSCLIRWGFVAHRFRAPRYCVMFVYFYDLHDTLIKCLLSWLVLFSDSREPVVVLRSAIVIVCPVVFWDVNFVIFGPKALKYCRRPCNSHR